MILFKIWYNPDLALLSEEQNQLASFDITRLFCFYE